MTSQTISAQGIFYSGEYYEVNGKFWVDPPKHCSNSRVSETCKIGLHSRVHRKDGPSHELLVYKCYVHQSTMRIYPPGWVPYARQPLFGDKSFFQTLRVFADASCIPATGVFGLCLRTMYRKVALFRKLLGCGDNDTEEQRSVSAQFLNHTALELNKFAVEIRAGPCRKQAEALVTFICPSVQSTRNFILCGTQKKCWATISETSSSIG